MEMMQHQVKEKLARISGIRRYCVEVIEVIPGLFYFWPILPSAVPPEDTLSFLFFSIDSTFVYHPFSLDFGPLDLSCVVKYCRLVKRKVSGRSQFILSFFFSLSACVEVVCSFESLHPGCVRGNSLMHI